MCNRCHVQLERHSWAMFRKPQPLQPAWKVRQYTVLHLQSVQQHAPDLYRRAFLASKLRKKGNPAVRLPFVLQYASHLYGSTPPICTAVLLEKYWGLGSPEHFWIQIIKQECVTNRTLLGKEGCNSEYPTQSALLATLLFHWKPACSGSSADGSRCCPGFGLNKLEVLIPLHGRKRKQQGCASITWHLLEKDEGATGIGATSLRGSGREICLWEGLWKGGFSVGFRGFSGPLRPPLRLPFSSQSCGSCCP